MSLSPLLSRSVALLGLVTFLSVCPLLLTQANDDYIRFITDSGSIVEIENHPELEGLNFGSSASTLQVPAPLPVIPPSGMAAVHRIVTRSNKQRLCGEMLVSALALVCKGHYKKRNNALPTGEVEYSNYQSNELYESGRPLEEPRSNWPDFFNALKSGAPAAYRISDHAEKSVGPARGHQGKVRAKRGVVDECCKNSCSTNQLSTYCGGN